MLANTSTSRWTIIVMCGFTVACIVGPAMIGVGIKNIVATIAANNAVTPRDRNVDAFNAAVAVFDAELFTGWQLTVSDAPSAVISSAVTIKGSTNGVNLNARSAILVAAVSSALLGCNQSTSRPLPSASTANVTFRSNRLVKNVISRSVPLQKTVSRSLRCTSDYCTTDCGKQDGSPYYCSLSKLLLQCTTVSTGRGVFAPKDGFTATAPCSSADDACGVCTYLGMLSAYSVVLQRVTGGVADRHFVALDVGNNSFPNASGPNATSNGTYVNVTSAPAPLGPFYEEDPTKQSCSYPFTENEQRYDPTDVCATSIQFSVYMATDPFIVLQQITRGTSDFGELKAAQPTGGSISLIVCGLLLMLGVGCYSYRTILMCCRRHMHNMELQEEIAMEKKNILLLAEERYKDGSLSAEEALFITGKDIGKGEGELRRQLSAGGLSTGGTPAAGRRSPPVPPQTASLSSGGGACLVRAPPAVFSPPKHDDDIL